MTTVLLVRHGRTTANTAGVLAGRSPGVHLDDHGEQQARALADRLGGLPLAGVVTSPLARCRETARLLLSGREIPVHTDRGLAEVDYGAWTNRALRDLAKEPLWQTVQRHPTAAVFPEGEGLAAMAARAVGTVRRWDAAVAEQHGPDAVWAAVSHGDVLKAVLADALGLHLDQFQRLVVDPASVSVVRYAAERPFVLMTNSTAGDLAGLRPPPARRRTRRRSSSDAVVGGGSGTAEPPGPRR